MSLDERAQVPYGSFRYVHPEHHAARTAVLEYKLYAKGIGAALVARGLRGSDREELLRFTPPPRGRVAPVRWNPDRGRRPQGGNEEAATGSQSGSREEPSRWRWSAAARVWPSRPARGPTAPEGRPRPGSAAALEYTGGGTVTETEVGDDGAAYGVDPSRRRPRGRGQPRQGLRGPRSVADDDGAEDQDGSNDD